MRNFSPYGLGAHYKFFSYLPLHSHKLQSGLFIFQVKTVFVPTGVSLTSENIAPLVATLPLEVYSLYLIISYFMKRSTLFLFQLTSVSAVHIDSWCLTLFGWWTLCFNCLYVLRSCLQIKGEIEEFLRVIFNLFQGILQDIYLNNICWACELWRQLHWLLDLNFNIFFFFFWC